MVSFENISHAACCCCCCCKKKYENNTKNNKNKNSSYDVFVWCQEKNHQQVFRKCFVFLCVCSISFIKIKIRRFFTSIKNSSSFYFSQILLTAYFFLLTVILAFFLWCCCRHFMISNFPVAIFSLFTFELGFLFILFFRLTFSPRKL